MNSAPTEVEEAVAMADRLESHMGLQDQRVLLEDCRSAARVIRKLLSDYARLQSESAKDGEAWEKIERATVPIGPMKDLVSPDEYIIRCVNQEARAALARRASPEQPK